MKINSAGKTALLFLVTSAMTACHQDDTSGFGPSVKVLPNNIVRVTDGGPAAMVEVVADFNMADSTCVQNGMTKTGMDISGKSKFEDFSVMQNDYWELAKKAKALELRK